MNMILCNSGKLSGAMISCIRRSLMNVCAETGEATSKPVQVVSVSQVFVEVSRRVSLLKL